MLRGEFAGLAVGKSDSDLSRRRDAAGTDNAFDLVLLEQEFDALGELAHHLGLLCHHGGQIEFDLGFDAQLGEIGFGFVQPLAGMQQGLGGNAADIEAGAAEAAAAVDTGRREAELAEPDSGIVAARAAADDNRVECVSHDQYLRKCRATYR